MECSTFLNSDLLQAYFIVLCSTSGPARRGAGGGGGGGGGAGTIKDVRGVRMARAGDGSCGNIPRPPATGNGTPSADQWCREPRRRVGIVSVYAHLCCSGLSHVDMVMCWPMTFYLSVGYFVKT